MSPDGGIYTQQPPKSLIASSRPKDTYTHGSGIRPRLRGHTIGALETSKSSSFTQSHMRGDYEQVTEISAERHAKLRQSSLSSASSMHSSQSSQSRRDSGYSSLAKMKGQRASDSRSSSKYSSESSKDHSSSSRHGSLRAAGPRQIVSSPHIPRAQANIDEALALHERSRQLFPEPSLHHDPEQNMQSGITGLYRNLSMTDGQLPPQLRPTSADGVAVAALPIRRIPTHVEGQTAGEEYVPATVMHWTSVETRRREYADIDRSHKGLRGFWKRLFPKLDAKSSRSRFYDDKEGSNAGSIRRYRLDLPDEEQ